MSRQLFIMTMESSRSVLSIVFIKVLFHHKPFREDRTAAKRQMSRGQILQYKIAQSAVRDKLFFPRVAF